VGSAGQGLRPQQVVLIRDRVAATVTLESVGRSRVRVPKTAQVVAHTLRGQIVRGELPEGAPLPSEAVLMERFGISRPSLREAFRILESERLIEVRRGSRGGARAARPDIEVAARYLGVIMQFDRVPLSDVFTARALIEPLVFRLLAEHADRRSITPELRLLLAELDAQTDAATFLRMFLEFFQVAFSRAGNRSMELMYGALSVVIGSELSDAITNTVPVTDTRRPSAPIRALLKVLDLVDQGKGAEAAEFWTGQMLSVSGEVARHHQGRTLVEVTDDF
jgi:DNA-binding FadR family transcriptional regulator